MSKDIIGISNKEGVEDPLECPKCGSHLRIDDWDKDFKINVECPLNCSLSRSQIERIFDVVEKNYDLPFPSLKDNKRSNKLIATGSFFLLMISFYFIAFEFHLLLIQSIGLLLILVGSIMINQNFKKASASLVYISKKSEEKY